MGTLSILENFLEVLLNFNLRMMDYWRHEVMCIWTLMMILDILMIVSYFCWHIFLLF